MVPSRCQFIRGQREGHAALRAGLVRRFRIKLSED
jgi:hypothetical protein